MLRRLSLICIFSLAAFAWTGCSSEFNGKPDSALDTVNADIQSAEPQLVNLENLDMDFFTMTERAAGDKILGMNFRLIPPTGQIERWKIGHFIVRKLPLGAKAIGQIIRRRTGEKVGAPYVLTNTGEVAVFMAGSFLVNESDIDLIYGYDFDITAELPYEPAPNQNEASASQNKILGPNLKFTMQYARRSCIANAARVAPNPLPTKARNFSLWDFPSSLPTIGDGNVALGARFRSSHQQTMCGWGILETFASNPLGWTYLEQRPEDLTDHMPNDGLADFKDLLQDQPTSVLVDNWLNRPGNPNGLPDGPSALGTVDAEIGRIYYNLSGIPGQNALDMALAVSAWNQPSVLLQNQDELPSAHNNWYVYHYQKLEDDVPFGPGGELNASAAHRVYVTWKGKTDVNHKASNIFLLNLNTNQAGFCDYGIRFLKNQNYGANFIDITRANLLDSNGNPFDQNLDADCVAQGNTKAVNYYPSDMVFQDVDGDGDPDLITTGGYPVGSTPGGRVFENIGDNNGDFLVEFREFTPAQSPLPIYNYGLFQGTSVEVIRVHNSEKPSNGGFKFLLLFSTANAGSIMFGGNPSGGSMTWTDLTPQMPSMQTANFHQTFINQFSADRSLDLIGVAGSVPNGKNELCFGNADSNPSQFQLLPQTGLPNEFVTGTWNYGIFLPVQSVKPLVSGGAPYYGPNNDCNPWEDGMQGTCTAQGVVQNVNLCLYTTARLNEGCQGCSPPRNRYLICNDDLAP